MQKQVMGQIWPLGYGYQPPDLDDRKGKATRIQLEQSCGDAGEQGAFERSQLCGFPSPQSAERAICVYTETRAVA